MNTPKMDCALKVYKDKEFYQLGFQVWVFEMVLVSKSESESFCMDGFVLLLLGSFVERWCSCEALSSCSIQCRIDAVIS